MTNLREDETKKRSVKIDFNNALNELDEINSEKALKLSRWFFKKAKYYKNYHNKKYNKLPDKLTRGDIVRVDFGINIGEELSDDSTDGHFAMIWSQQGMTFLVLPLTKTIQTKNPHSVNSGKIQGMPEDMDTYVKLDYIRWVYSLRIKRLAEYPTGKLIIHEPEKLNDVLKKIKEKMLDVFINN